MIFSKKWLERYFPKGLPEVDRVADIINLHAFEVDDIQSVDDDFALDIKILPDRSPYASSHCGMANEISAISNLPITIPEIKDVILDSKISDVKVEIENKKDCPRYLLRRVEGVEIKETTGEIKTLLQNIGERAIYNIVDFTNYCLFDMGQPLHAFDADKIRGKIFVRRAKIGEKMTTLDNRELILDNDSLVIADQEGPLALAGIKGGKRAEIDRETKNIILESANFNPILIRRAVQKFNLATSASRRFESGLSLNYALLGMKEVSGLINRFLPKSKFGKIIDIGSENEKSKKIEIAHKFVSEILGVNIGVEDIKRILERLNIKVILKGEGIIAEIPPERKDLQIPEDLVEEIGRILGYDLIKPVLPMPLKTRSLPNRQFSAIEKIRQLLVDYGYFDTELYTFTDHGNYEVMYPMAEDKNFLRTNLNDGLLKSVRENNYRAPFLGLSEIRQFEIGQVFTQNGEETHLAMVIFKSEGQAVGNYGMEEVTNILSELEKILNTNLKMKVLSGSGFYLIEADITESIGRFIAPFGYDELGLEKASKVKHQDFSIYPFVLRDVAVFIPADILPEMVSQLITETAGPILQKIYLFDVFEKEISGVKKKSLAFHLVFQADDKTLTDGEINEIIDKVTVLLNSQKGFEVR